MEKETKIIKNCGKIYVAILILCGLISFFVLADAYGEKALILLVVYTLTISVYAYIAYVNWVKVKSQSIIIEQNKEILKKLSK